MILNRTGRASISTARRKVDFAAGRKLARSSFQYTGAWTERRRAVVRQIVSMYSAKSALSSSKRYVSL